MVKLFSYVLITYTLGEKIPMNFGNWVKTFKGGISSKRSKSYIFFEHGLKKNYNGQKHKNLDFCSILLLQ